MKPTFDYVEDYMEFIGGWRDASGKLRGLFDTVPSPISLARYDVKVVESKWPPNRPVCFCRSEKGRTLGWCGVAGFGVPGCEH